MSYATSLAARAAYRKPVPTSETWIRRVAREALDSPMGKEREWTLSECIGMVRQNIANGICPANGRDALDPSIEVRFDPQSHVWASQAATKMFDSHRSGNESNDSEFSPVELILVEANAYRARHDDLGNLIAVTLEDLAEKVGTTGTTNPELMQRRLAGLS